MHEVALCQALISQVETIARDHSAVGITAITLGLAPLSGIEARLLEHPYPVAIVGTAAEGAELIIQATPIRVCCNRSNTETNAAPNRLQNPIAGPG